MFFRRVIRTYDQFQMKLKLEEYESEYDSCGMDSDGSYSPWRNSTRNNRQMITPQNPIPGQKRRICDESDMTNQTFVVKRPRMDKTVIIEDDSVSGIVTEADKISGNQSAEINDVNGHMEANTIIEIPNENGQISMEKVPEPMIDMVQGKFDCILCKMIEFS